MQSKNYNILATGEAGNHDDSQIVKNLYSHCIYSCFSSSISAIIIIFAVMKRKLVGLLHRLRWAVYPSPRIDMQRVKDAFRGKTVVITGASHGIGRALALLMMEAGARLVLMARSEDELQGLCQKAEAMGCEARYIAIDLRDRDALEGVCKRLRDEMTEVDYLFCNAGKSICRTVMKAQDRMHDYDRTMDTNYRAMVALTLALLPSLLKARGRMVYTSSVSTLYPAVGGWSAYHASKAAANVWCRTADRELRKEGVRVKIAYMPLVHTDMSDVNPDYKDLPGYSAADAARLLAKLAMGSRKSYMPWWAVLN